MTGKTTLHIFKIGCVWLLAGGLVIALWALFPGGTASAQAAPDLLPGGYVIEAQAAPDLLPGGYATEARMPLAAPPYTTTTIIAAIVSHHPDVGSDPMVGFAVIVTAEVSKNAPGAGVPQGTVSLTTSPSGPVCTMQLAQKSGSNNTAAGSCGLFFETAASPHTTYSINAHFTPASDWVASDSGADPSRNVRPLSLSWSLDAGRYHTCALDNTGSFECWGLSVAYTTTMQNNKTAVSAGGYNTCSIRTNGDLDCWGENSYLNTPPAPTTYNTGFLALSVGDAHACAIDTHNLLHCWGDPEAGEVLTPTTELVKAVSAGNSYDCAIREEDDKLVCWGASWTDMPTGVVTAVSVGNRHACAIRSSDSNIRCWGETGVTLPNFGSTAYTSLSSGSDYTCARRSSDNHLICSGPNASLIPVDTDAYFTFDSGFLHTCALQAKAGSPPYYLACWGRNTERQAPRIGLAPTAIQAYLPLNRPWSQTFVPSGGAPAYTISNPSGAIPPGLGGLGIPGAYTLSGAPNTAGAYNNFVLQTVENSSAITLPLELKPLQRAYGATVQDPTTSAVLEGPVVSVTVGMPVVVTMTISASATPILTGSVMITGTGAGGVEKTCQASVTGSGNPGHGTAQCALFFITPGAKTIQGRYLGGPFYLPSTAASISAQIDPITIDPLVSAGNYFNCSLDVTGQAFCWGKGDSGQTSPPTGNLYNQLSASNAFACARRLDSQLDCWGWDGYGVATPPTTTGFIAATTGASHACGLDWSGTATCWGNPANGRTIPAAGSFIQISAGDGHTCGVLMDTGEASCWGLNTSDQANPPVGVNFTQLSSGGDFTCGIRSSDGGLQCWGGFPSPTTDTGFKALDAGYAHLCAIRADDTLSCWGDNTYGQTNAPSGVAFSQVSAGRDHTCAIRTDGYLMCWGNNTNGQAPVLSITPAVLPTLDVGAPWSLDLEASGGRLSTTSYVFSSDPTPPLPGLSLDSNSGQLAGTPILADQYNYTVRLAESDFSPALVTERTYAQTVRSRVVVSITATTPSQPMVGLPLQVDVSVTETPGGAMGAMPTLTVTVTADGGVSCRALLSSGGANSTGSCALFFTSSGEKSLAASYVGDANFMPGDSAAAPAVIQVAPFSHAPQVHTGLERTYIHLVDGSLACRGTNCSQINLETVYTAVDVGDALACALRTDGQALCKPNGLAAYLKTGPFTALSVGAAHACALALDGSAQCWGENGSGQAAPPSGVFSALSAGDDFTCAVGRSTGGLACWGNAPGGMPLTGIYTQVSVGADHACALSSSGALVCWGDNAYGQTNAPASGVFQQVRVGDRHSCALAQDGRLACWGDASLGAGLAPYGVFTALDAYADHNCALRSGLRLTCWGQDDYGEAPRIQYLPLTTSEIVANQYWEHIFLPSGGVKPYAGGISYGALPPGLQLLQLSPSGVVLYGTPSLPGQYSFVILWQDSASIPLVAEQPYTLTVTGADLQARVIPAHPTTAVYNSPFSYQYVITNATSLSVPDVLLTVELPDGLGGLSYGGVPSCVQTGLRLECPLASLAPYASLTLTATGIVTAPVGAWLTTTLEIQPQQADWPDIAPGSNQASHRATVEIQGLVFYDPFDVLTVDPRWSGGSVLTTTTGISYLGDFTNSDELRLRLDGLPPHKRVQVSFDLYVIGPWQGNTESTPGIVGLWRFGQFGQAPLLSTTFCNDALCTQAYPQAYPGGVNPWRSGASAWDVLGYTVPDTRYALNFSFLHDADFLELLFSSLNLPAGVRWGLDNVRVMVDGGVSFFWNYLPFALK